MGKTTDIAWTDHTFNPWHGCFKVSEGCTNCYAETLAKRWGHNVWGPARTTERRMMSDACWRQPLHWNAEAVKAGARRRVFCASMADVFEDHPQLPPVRRRLWNLIEDTPHLDWLLLTKRPENIATMLPQKYWPNVWLGTSTEDQQRADERVPVLLRYRELASVLFLSAEPLLGPIELSDVSRWKDAVRWLGRPIPIDWVIVGGESGPRHRPFNPDWARDLRDQCAAAAIAYFFKQHGGRTHAEGGCELDGREHKAFPERRRELAHA